jgi:hypothetical protein
MGPGYSRSWGPAGRPEEEPKTSALGTSSGDALCGGQRLAYACGAQRGSQDDDQWGHCGRHHGGGPRAARSAGATCHLGSQWRILVRTGTLASLGGAGTLGGAAPYSCRCPVGPGCRGHHGRAPVPEVGAAALLPVRGRARHGVHRRCALCAPWGKILGLHFGAYRLAGAPGQCTDSGGCVKCMCELCC